MKELSIKEKAKRYDEALEKSKRLYEQGTITESLCYVFPELKESEDEEIREALLEHIKGIESWEYFLGISKEQMIAWLEKQGEQKEYTFKSLPRLLDMIEPTSKAKAYCQKLIDALVKEGYTTDAKIVGECLKAMNGENVPMAIMDEKQGEQKPAIVDIMKNYFATTPKEQQDKDWEELKHLNNFGWKLIEQKPAWSEEDEKSLCMCLGAIGNPNYCYEDGDLERMRDFLKNLISRVQPKQEWSEEDKRSIRDSIFYLKSAKKYFEKDDDILWDEKWFNLCIEFLEALYKKLQPQPQWKPSKEQIEILDMVLSNESMDDNIARILRELREQLKKL